jgi:glucosamine--fructose-6-phosphate aminotransferase (isomerizing)
VNPDGFLADVLAEPAGLDAVLGAATAPGAPLARIAAELPGRRVVLTGMGSSRFAALPAAARLRRRGVHAVAELSSTDLPAPPGDDVVAIGISASGATEETVEALARHAGRSRTVAITNDPAGPLAGVADIVLELHAGREAGGVACRTFQATVALLHLLAGADPAVLRRAPGAQAALLDARGGWLDELLARLEAAGAVHAIAPDARIASSLQGALMFREGPRVPASGSETGDWLHVDVYLTKRPGYRALLFGGSRYDAGVIEWARERGSEIVAVGRRVDGAVQQIAFPHAEDELVASLVETSVAELAAAEWWRRRAAAGAMP